jgi:hypothetical protein
MVYVVVYWAPGSAIRVLTAPDGSDQKVTHLCIVMGKGIASAAAVCVCVTQIGNAVEFVKLLLDMREKYESTIAQAFSDDKNFKNTLNSVSSALAIPERLDSSCGC